jgi:hypothetical protein
MVLALACTENTSGTDATGTAIAFLFDGSASDAELVTSPALAGLELAAHEAGGVEVEPVNVGLDPEDVTASLRDLGDDRGVIAAVVAPWAAPPDGAIDLLAAEGIPVVSLSWAWGPPREGKGFWVSFAAGRAREAIILLNARPGPTVCLAGDDDVTSRALLVTAEELGRGAGNPEIRTIGIVRTGRPATPEAVAARITGSGCTLLDWVGSADVAASVLASVAQPPSVVGTSRMKTDAGLELTSSGAAVFTVCACADVSLSIDPVALRFVHDLQAESGSPPGPFAVEAYDAGRLLIGLGGDAATRGRVAEGLDDLVRFRGLVDSYAFEPDGSRSPGSLRTGLWQAAGSRWLPEPTSVVFPG